MTALACALVGVGVSLVKIDFTTHRVDREQLSIETVQRGTMEIKVSANGRLLPKHIEHLASRVTGRVAKAYVKPGDAVTVGQLLVELTNPQLIASAEEAQSALEGAVIELKASAAKLKIDLLDQEVVLTRGQFALEKAQLELEVDTKLFSDRAIAEIDFKRMQIEVARLTKTRALEESRLRTISDNIEVQLAVERSRVTQRARALDRANDRAADLKIVAGIDGIVQAIEVDVGQQLQPGSPIGGIAQHDRLYAELGVPAREAVEVQAGQKVVIDTRRGTVDGIVARVDPAVTRGAVIVDVDLSGAPPAGARPQMAIEGIIYLSRVPNALYVGKPSYVRTNGAMTVFKLDGDGRYATRVTIEAGKLSLDYLEVLKGLSAGDRIITSEIGEWQDSERILIN